MQPADVTSTGTGFSDAIAIYSNGNAFAVLRQDSEVRVWGNSSYGGDNSIQSSLTGVKHISYGNHYHEGKYYTSRVIDPAPPSQPVINTISSPTNDNTPTITGTCSTNGAGIMVYEGTNFIASGTVVNGVWSSTPWFSMNDGTYIITATATKVSYYGPSSTSAPSATQTFVIDATAPSAPVINPIITPTTDTHANNYRNWCYWRYNNII